MKRLLILLASASPVWLGASHLLAQNTATTGSAEISSANPESPAPSLRKPGFVFMELATTRVEEYLTFFAGVADFKPVTRKPGYIQASSDRAELTFIDPSYWSHGHPFSGKVTGSGQGIGIEIGIVVADLDKAYAAAVKFKDSGFPISTGIVLRPWGLRDFRVLAPEGYYFRFTEGR
jgi:hypothetical protein